LQVPVAAVPQQDCAEPPQVDEQVLPLAEIMQDSPVLQVAAPPPPPPAQQACPEPPQA
jgi:hypothetical protein